MNIAKELKQPRHIGDGVFMEGAGIYLHFYDETTHVYLQVNYQDPMREGDRGCWQLRSSGDCMREFETFQDALEAAEDAAPDLLRIQSEMGAPRKELRRLDKERVSILKGEG